MSDHIYKYPRLYLNPELAVAARISLASEQAHYLKNVLRRGAGDFVRVFNGRDGEWLAAIVSADKRGMVLDVRDCLRPQLEPRVSCHLYFSPIRKQRMDFLVEKAVELGVTALTPALMHRTEARIINEDRIRAQIIEAAEQCERMDIPALLPVRSLPDILKQARDIPLYVCLERGVGVGLKSLDLSGGAAFLIGCEGGFDPQEAEAIRCAKGVMTVDLGADILRAETAALACLAYMKLSTADTV